MCQERSTLGLEAYARIAPGLGDILGVACLKFETGYRNSSRMADQKSIEEVQRRLEMVPLNFAQLEVAQASFDKSICEIEMKRPLFKPSRLPGSRAPTDWPGFHMRAINTTRIDVLKEDKSKAPILSETSQMDDSKAAARHIISPGIIPAAILPKRQTYSYSTVQDTFSLLLSPFSGPAARVIQIPCPSP